MKRWLIPSVIAVVALAAVPALAFGLGSQARAKVDPSTAPKESKVQVPAPINSVDIRVMESFPPQYVARVEFGLRNGCIEPAGYEVEDVEQESKLIRVGVYVFEPADPETVCAQIYGTGAYDILLNGDFVSGETYTVVVNDTRPVSFTAQ